MSFITKKINYFLFVMSVLYSISSCVPLHQYTLIEMPLLPVDSLNKNWQVTQSVTISPLKEKINDNITSTFITAWSVQDKQLTIVGLTATGQILMRLDYTNQELTEYYSPLIKRTIPGKEIMALLQLAHWPIVAIETTFKDTQWQVNALKNERDIYVDKQRAVNIINAPEGAPSGQNDAIIHNYINRYTLHIKTLTINNLQ